MKDLKVRLITAVIGIIILVGVIKLGGLTLGLGTLFLSIVGLNEFYKALENIDYKPIHWAGYISTIGLFLSIYFERITFQFVLIIMVLLLLIEFLFKDNIKIHDLGVTLLGVLYIPLSLMHIYLLDGDIFIALVFLVGFGSDTFAYFAGNLFGKRKLSPKVSPNKSVEGSIGGIIGSIILACVFNYIFVKQAMWKFVIIGALGSVVSQLGDLVASKIKRTAQIKDYGKLMPGHGGVLDRFDSIIFCGPLIYYSIDFLL
ncbi:MAG TPA: phosphatidate cytidylyltransferase [Tissierellaceae bacterium]